MSLHIRVNTAVDAPLATVVAEVAEFASLGRWHTAALEFAVEGSGIGATRSYRIGEGLYRERLDEIAEGGRGYRYTLLDAPFTFASSEGQLWARRNGEGALVEWSADVYGASLPDEFLEPMLRGIIDVAMTTLKAKLERAR
jgi:hypothetical protein